MPTYHVEYTHLGDKQQITLEVDGNSLGDDQEFRDAIARRLAERILPHAELAFRHEDERTLEQKLNKAYDVQVNKIERE
ncbi:MULTISPECIES: hypothetical protein [Idiomarina]|uniref:hypothetical protein n=1 Tax=Idiomarina TaxID=135575 RepID=UPI000C3D7022|nr:MULTISPECIES: hypothetical protein [Idiomarina]MBP58036.1 hypothetical protein [Idiomarina sp.]|tara:strand:- start:7876 stop:8112 length:237 start_codon:yes stop_codon:yes gene_type:complete